MVAQLLVAMNHHCPWPTIFRQNNMSRVGWWFECHPHYRQNNRSHETCVSAVVVRWLVAMNHHCPWPTIFRQNNMSHGGGRARLEVYAYTFDEVAKCSANTSTPGSSAA